MTDFQSEMYDHLKLILDELQDREPLFKQGLIVFCFDELKKWVDIAPSHAEFARVALATATMLTDFGYGADYIAASLIHYPNIFKGIQTQELQKKGAAAVGILGIVDTLAIIHKYFESYLPWMEKNNPSSPTKEKSSNEFWDEHSLEIKSDAFLAIAGSPEIAVVKFIDRLYLLRTIEKFNLDTDVVQQLANDSLAVVAPAAEALGMWSVKWQIEDYSFKILNPEKYWEIANDLQEKREQREWFIQRVISEVYKQLQDHNIAAVVTGRPKHIYGLYKKMKNTGKPVMAINDNMSIRIITQSEDKEDCYNALAVLTSNWHIAEGIYEKGKKIRDWIKTPKPNGYESIHTNIIFEERLLEVQIRNQEMHDLAEYGAAAHWIYRKTGKSEGLPNKYQAYIHSMKKLRTDLERYQTKRR